MHLARWPYPRVFAHRGAGTLAPENTLAAFQEGWNRGYRAVEFDVMLTQDEVPVLMHDVKLGRTVAGVGAVDQLRAAELLRLDAGAWFDPRFAGERVPSFDAALDFCEAHAIFMNIEIKPAPGAERRTGEMVAASAARFFASRPARARQAGPLFSSFSRVALEGAYAEAPEIARAHLFDRIPDDWERRIATLQCAALHCNERHLRCEQVADIVAKGLGVFCYTVNDPGRARQLLGWGVDAICTDRLDLFAPDFAASLS